MIVKKKIRKDMILHKLKQIEENLILVEENLPSKLEDFLHLGLAKDGIYKKIEFAIENMIDVCSIINSDLALGIPADEDNIITNITKSRIISNLLANKIMVMKGFRNILVHKYGEIDDEHAFENIKQGLGDFTLFIKEIRKFLSKTNKTRKK